MALFLFGIVSVLAIKFPNVHVAVAREWIDLALVTALLTAVLISAYRKLLRRPGYWLVLGIFLIAHLGSYTFFFRAFPQEFSPIQTDIVFGIVSGVEFICFVIAILKIYHVGPNLRFL